MPQGLKTKADLGNSEKFILEMLNGHFGMIFRTSFVKNLVRALLKSVLLHDPLGVHPSKAKILEISKNPT